MKQLTKKFPAHSFSSHPLVHKIDIQLYQGKCYLLEGDNGSGKTTLFNLLSGYLKPDQGQIIYHQDDSKYDLTQLPPHQIARLGIGRLFQQPQLFPHLTGWENLLLAQHPSRLSNPLHAIFSRLAIRSHQSELKEKALSILSQFSGLVDKEAKSTNWEQLLHQPAPQLSFGQQRLVEFVRLMLGNYRLWLLDEPSAGIHASYVKVIVDILKKCKLTSGMTIWMIEHQFEPFLSVVDERLKLTNGKLVVHS